MPLDFTELQQRMAREAIDRALTPDKIMEELAHTDPKDHQKVTELTIAYHDAIRREEQRRFSSRPDAGYNTRLRGDDPMPGQTYAPYPNTGSAGTPNNDPGGLLVPLDAQIEQIKRELDHTRARLAEANTVVKHLAVRRDTLEAILAGLTTTRREAGKIANVPMVELQAGGMVVGHYPDPATYHPPRGHSDEINTPYPPPEQPMERRWDGTDPIVPPPNTR